MCVCVCECVCVCVYYLYLYYNNRWQFWQTDKINGLVKCCLQLFIILLVLTVLIWLSPIIQFGCNIYVRAKAIKTSAYRFPLHINRCICSTMSNDFEINTPLNMHTEYCEKSPTNTSRSAYTHRHPN